MDEIHRQTSLQDNRRIRKAVQRTCKVCGRKFYGINDITGKHGSKVIRISKYCSKACWSIRATIINRCSECGKEIKTTKSVNKRYCGMACRDKRYKLLTGELSTAWKGDKVSYSGVHKCIYDKYGIPKVCEKCGREGQSKNMNWANISGTYKRDRSDWVRLCPTCHRLFDNSRKRYAKFIEKGEEWEKITPKL